MGGKEMAEEKKCRAYIASQHIVLHDVEAALVFVVLRCLHLPLYLSRK